MDTFFMLGTYLPGETRNIAAHRTNQLHDIVTRLGGKVVSAYALLGQYDLVLIVELPSLDDAMRAAIGLGNLIGIKFRTSVALPIDAFDKLVDDLATEIESARMEAGE